MEQSSTKTDADGTALFGGDAWFDPIEAGIRDRVRGFIQEWNGPLNSTFRILRCMAEGVRKSLQECGRDLYGFRAGPGHG